MTPEELGALRADYAGTPLDVTDVDPDPFIQFQAWFTEARAAEVREPEAMALATADTTGMPSVRFVLLRALDDRGFGFVTNLGSRKGTDVSTNPRAALAFHWPEVMRQVRAHGVVRPMEADVVDRYFASRPLEARWSAWASPQGQVIPDREWLERRVLEVQREHGDTPERPDHWSGFVVLPDEVEFWQGRPGRLHDRVRYRRVDNAWVIERLAP